MNFYYALFVDDDGPPLSNTDVKNLVILTELPFVVSFEERVKVLMNISEKLPFQILCPIQFWIWLCKPGVISI